MIEKFRQYLQDEDKSKNTIDSYVQHINLYIQWFGGTKGLEFNKLHRENVKDYVSYLRTIKALSPKSINAKISALIKFNEFLVDNKIQQDYVVSKKDKLKVQQQYASLANVEYEDVEKFRQLILDGETSKRNYALITLMAYSGLRISEAINLKVTDINLTSHEIIVYEGKGTKTRTVFMNEKVKNALKSWLKERLEKSIVSDFIFASNRGTPVNRTVINKLFKKYSQEVGKEITPHDLRHFFCSHAINKGMSVHEVANQAGHSNIHTTLLYTNPTKSQLKDKMNLM